MWIVDKPIKNINVLKQKKNAKTDAKIASLPLNKANISFKGLKVGDTVPRSDNWDAFVVVEIISNKHVVGRFPPSKERVWINTNTSWK
jgi:hypothetical protein